MRSEQRRAREELCEAPGGRALDAPPSGGPTVSSWGPLGALLGPSRVPLGALFWPSWSHL
eukprot:2457874-Pyramimonas_sp.AAC.1